MSNNKTFAVIIEYLEEVIDKRNNSSSSSYTSNLLKKDIDNISQKVGEEAIEVVIAACIKNKNETVHESADLLFHLMVLWKKLGIKLDDIAKELESRKK